MLRFAKACALLCALCVLAMPLSAARAATKITVGIIPVAEFIPCYVGVEKGFFAKHGLEVNLVPIPLAANMPASLMSGSVQIGMTTTPIFLQARENGIDLAAIQGFTFDQGTNPQLSLLANKAANIKTAKDLEGKKVAVPGLNSLFDTALRKWMITKGADPTKVKFTEAPMPLLTDILRKGTVDAIAIIDPFRAKALHDGYAVKVSDYLVEMKDPALLAFWIVSRDWAAKNKAVVDGYKAAIAESIAWVKEHSDEAREVGKKHLKAPIPPKWPNWSTDLTPASFEFQANMERELGVLKKPVDTSVLILK